MLSAETENKNITIIGAGLVGSLLAIYLGQRGYQVKVFDKLPDIRKESISAGRSINLALANRGIRSLQQVAIMEEVEKLLTTMRGRMLHDENEKLQFQPYGQKEEEVIYSVSRGGLVSLLRSHAEATGNVTFQFKHQLTSIDFQNNNLEFWDLVDDTTVSHSYNILIGADGAGSRVRRSIEPLMNASFESHILSHSYKELTIPAKVNGGYQIRKEALHIWPRGEYMLIALPNLDGSFTVTLFMPNKGAPSFESLKSKQDVSNFFRNTFPDAADLIPNLTEEYFNNPTGLLGTLRCDNWHYDNVLLIGDACHAIVPFHGQGMNCGFEDCAELNSLLNKFNDDWSRVMPEFTQSRKANADAIADMALDNYIEMRDTVREQKFHLKKAIAFELEKLYPLQFIPRYSMVSFHHIPYAEAQRRGKIQKQILEKLSVDISSIEQLDYELAKKFITEQLNPLSKEHL